MSFGFTVGNVRMTRSYVEPTGGLTELRKASAPTAPVKVTVEATQSDNGTFELVVTALGESTSVRDVHPDDLAERIARLIQVVSKAARNGELTKHRQRDSAPLGLGTPVSGKSNLRFG